MLRARRSAVLAVFSLLLLHESFAHAQNASADAFSLQNFRPSVDSKGYVTVNASQVLGHLDFSFGLVGSYARNVLNLSANGNHFDVQNYLTPQLQGAIGFFKFLELGVSLPVHIMFGQRSPGFKDPGDMANFNNDLSFSGQDIGDIGIHLKGRILNTSKYP